MCWPTTRLLCHCFASTIRLQLLQPSLAPAGGAVSHPYAAVGWPSLRPVSACCFPHTAVQVILARQVLTEVSLSEEHARFLVQQAARLGCHGQRAEVAAARVARAAAALRHAGPGQLGWRASRADGRPITGCRPHLANVQRVQSVMRAQARQWGGGKGRGFAQAGLRPAPAHWASPVHATTRPSRHATRGSTRVEAPDLQAAVQLAILPRATVMEAPPPRPPQPQPPAADSATQQEREEESQQREQAAAEETPPPPAQFMVGVQQVTLDPSGEREAAGCCPLPRQEAHCARAEPPMRSPSLLCADATGSCWCQICTASATPTRVLTLILLFTFQTFQTIFTDDGSTLPLVLQ